MHIHILQFQNPIPRDFLFPLPIPLLETQLVVVYNHPLVPDRRREALRMKGLESMTYLGGLALEDQVRTEMAVWEFCAH